jgi:cold shock CspA family protein
VTTYTGTLKFFRSDRPNGGFGFIKRDNSPVDDFLHISALPGINADALADGFTRFSYELVADAKNGKNKATNVRIIE